MGTSASSKGPTGNVPFVPPWVPPIPPAEDAPDAEIPDSGQQSPPPSQPITEPGIAIAPPRRFTGARLNLGRFGRTGLENDLKSGLSHYARTGLGGGRRATQRMSGTAHTAGKLYDILDVLRSGEQPISQFEIDLGLLAGRPAKEVGDHIIEAVCPVDGKQDTDASRDSIARAIADLVEQNPDADLTALSQDQIEFITERYVAYDLCCRIQFDVGNAVINKTDPATGVRRLEEMNQYIKAKVAECFRLQRERGQQMARHIVSSFSVWVINNVFTIFEGWVQ